jgi:hypothetical protein
LAIALNPRENPMVAEGWMDDEKLVNILAILLARRKGD